MPEKEFSARINWPTGEPGSILYTEVATSRSVTIADAGRTLRVDPGGGTVTLTLELTPDTGFFCQICQVGAGTVDFIAGAGATVDSTVGATPAVAAQFGCVTCERHPGTQWIVAGAIA